MPGAVRSAWAACVFTRCSAALRVWGQKKEATSIANLRSANASSMQAEAHSARKITPSWCVNGGRRQRIGRQEWSDGRKTPSDVRTNWQTTKQEQQQDGSGGSQAGAHIEYSRVVFTSCGLLVLFYQRVAWPPGNALYPAVDECLTHRTRRVQSGASNHPIESRLNFDRPDR